MVNLNELEDIQLDALREVANIGAGHAATALSQLTRSRIMVNAPHLEISRLEDVPDVLPEPDEVVAAVMMHMLGDLTGRTLLVLPRASAMRLAEILMAREPGSSNVFGELEQSAIKEAGNILTSAYLTALSDFMGLMLLPSVPSLTIDLSGAVLTTAYTNFGHERDYVVCVDTRFSMEEGGEEEGIRGHFILLPDVESLEVILQSVRLA